MRLVPVFLGADTLLQELVEEVVACWWEGVGSCVGAAGNAGNTREGNTRVIHGRVMPSPATR